jgi:hypothetical protein
MTFNELSKDQQESILAYAERAGIDTNDIDQLNELANKYDNLVYTTLVTQPASAGILAGYRTKNFINQTKNEIINTMLDNSISRAIEYDQNLMIINRNEVVSPLCAPYQNKIYWTIRPEGNYPELDPALWKNQSGKGRKGLFHPNCRHYINAYFPGESDPPEDYVVDKKKEEEDYKLQQELNYIKRNKKKWYARKERARLTESPHQAYETKKWKEWTTRQNEFISLHGEMRM